MIDALVLLGWSAVVRDSTTGDIWVNVIIARWTRRTIRIDPSHDAEQNIALLTFDQWTL
jgi:hypothetical protein